MSLLSMTSNLVGGWVSDRMKLKYLLMFMMTMQAVGTVGVINWGDPAWRVVLIIGFGLSGGLFGSLVNVTWPQYFGTLHLGAISGQNMSIMVKFLINHTSHGQRNSINSTSFFILSQR